MMFLCNKCENVFKEATEDNKCPHCNSEDYVEAKQCSECGDWVDDNDIIYVEEEDSYLCSDCHNSWVNKLSPEEEYELAEFKLGWDEYVA